MDEHRIGLHPILKRVWAPTGHRPEIAVYPRYEWLYLYGFVQPSTGMTDWFILAQMNTKAFSVILEKFAQSTSKHILLVMDQAPWHRSSNLIVPDNITIIFQPPYSPEVQPAEHLWQFTDKPFINTCPDSLQHLEQTLSDQCEYLKMNPDIIKKATCFHWWPST